MAAPKIFRVSDVGVFASGELEPSVSTDGTFVFSTFATLTKLSDNAGVTFNEQSSAFDVYPAADGGNLNFDQDTVWIKPIQRFAWVTMTVRDKEGRSRLRVAFTDAQHLNERDASSQ